MKYAFILIVLLLLVVWKGWDQPLRYLTMSQEQITEEQDQKLAAALAKVQAAATPTPTPRPDGKWMWENHSTSPLGGVPELGHSTESKPPKH